MTASLQYTYCDGDLLVDRNTYFYSTYHGAPFLDAWRAVRTAARQAQPDAGHTSPPPEQTPTDALLARIKSDLDTPANRSGALEVLDRMVQRFEVTKRVHDAYTAQWRAQDVTQFRTLGSYVALAELFVQAFDRTRELTYLNALLKISDTLCSAQSRLSTEEHDRFVAVLEAEHEAVETVITQSRTPRSTLQGTLTPLPTDCVSEARVTLLATDSARSRAYLHALLHVGCPPQQVILLGEDRPTAPATPLDGTVWQGLLKPDLSTPVAATCAAHAIPMIRSPAPTVNTPEVIQALQGCATDIVIYSGFGGQIVSAEVLSCGPRFLHMHSGWLPDFRGSTTLYYALLKGAPPGVTAIFLDPGIDTGPIVARKQYPTPVAGMDLDLVFDTAIRADLMCRVLGAGQIEPVHTQSVQEGRTYYVIHPVLKHIALLSLEAS